MTGTKNILCALALMGLVQVGKAQNITDEIQTGITGVAYANDVYYSLETGSVKTASNKDWQLAFTIGAFNVGIRANTVTSSTKDGAITIYERGTDVSQWAAFTDTTGFSAWTPLNNSDEDWEGGALNQNAGAGGAFDYGWGVYNTSSHIITGNRLYLVVFNNSGTNEYKKLQVIDKNLGVWTLRYADLDGSNEHNIEIKSADYQGKLFAYLSFFTNQVTDREPANASWDFVLTRYAAASQGFYGTTGILTNAGVMVAEVRGKDEQTTTIADTIETTLNISEIGYDWKKLNAGMTGYDAVDSLSYFVKDKAGNFWKLVFTSFDLSNGKTTFEKTKLNGTTGIGDAGNTLQTAVYPNPAAGSLHVVYESSFSQTTFTFADLTGKTVLLHHAEGTGFRDEVIDVASLSKGIYLLHVQNGSGHTVQKVVVNQ